MCPLPEHPWCPAWDSATFRGPHPVDSLPSPLSWQLQSAGLFPESGYKGKTHSMEFSRIQSASSGSDSLWHCGPAIFPCESERGPRRTAGRGIALRLTKGTFRGHLLCHQTDELPSLCAGGGVSAPAPLPPSPPGRRAGRRAGGSSARASGSPRAFHSAHFKAEEEVWVHFWSDIFSKEQYLFWWNTTSRYYLFFKNSKIPTQPQRMFPPRCPGDWGPSPQQYPLPAAPRIFTAFRGDSNLSPNL